MSGTLSPVAVQTFVNGDGLPYAAGLLYVYLAGSATPSPTWNDAALTSLNPNPIVLDSAGRCVIYLDSLSYKFVLKDSSAATIWTQDNVSAVTLGQSVLGEIFSFVGTPSEPISQLAYPTGPTYDKLHGGTAILAVDAATLVGSYALAGMMLADTGQSVTAALVNLTDGSPDTPIATISSTSTTGERQLSGPITFPAGGSTKQYGIKVKVSGGVGFIWGLSLVRTG
jgi:hypothetical protein